MKIIRARNRIEEYELRARYLKDEFEMAGSGRRQMPFRINRIVNLLSFSRDDRVLDIGPGNGHFLQLIQSRVAECHGVDPSSTMVERLREKFKDSSNVRFAVSRSSSLPFPPRYFDKVVMSAVIAYLDSQEEVMETLSEIRRISKPSATVIISDVPFVNEALLPPEDENLLARATGKLREEGIVELARSVKRSIVRKIRIVLELEPVLIPSDHGLYFSEEQFLEMCRQNGLQGRAMRTEMIDGPPRPRNDYLLCPTGTHSKR